jgi:hypothetical protein
MLRSIFAFGLIGMAMMMLPELASAQATYICPTGPGPGERQIGMTNGGQGVASVPVCVADGGSTTSAPPPAEPSDVLGGAARMMFGAFSVTRAEMEKMKNDPRYRQFMEGDWKFFDDVHQGKKVCGAAFFKQGQVILLSGPGDPGEVGSMSFLDFRDDATIPGPDKEKKVRVKLTQNDEAPQTVVAINNAGSSGEGIISMGVPRMDAIVNSIDDAVTFKLEIEGKVVVDTDWHDGRKAQDFLRKCIGL